jgi:hypothetical protein
LAFGALQQNQLRPKMTFIKSAFAVSTLLFSLNCSAFAGDTLSQSELKQLVPGRYTVTLYNAVSMTVTLRPNGTVQGTSKTERDSGTWRLSGNQICIGWTKWLGGQTRCSGLTSEGSYYKGSGFTFRRI